MRPRVLIVVKRMSMPQRVMLSWFRAMAATTRRVDLDQHLHPDAA
jgi:hypothetical protein